MNEPAKAAKKLLVDSNLFRRKSRRRIGADAFFRGTAPGVRSQNAAKHVLVARHPEIDIEMMHQPTRAANVIRMPVGCYDVGGRITAHRPGKSVLPDSAALLCVDAGIDDDSTGTISKQPQVNVIQSKRQRHPQPENIVRHLLGCALGRPGIEFVLDLGHCAMFTRPEAEYVSNCEEVALRRLCRDGKQVFYSLNNEFVSGGDGHGGLAIEAGPLELRICHPSVNGSTV